MTTQFFHHDIYVEHLVPQGHPERPDRIRAVYQRLDDPEFDDLVRIKAPAADPATYLYAHPENYVAALENSVPEEGLLQVDADTSMSPKTWEAVSHAVGAANAAVDAVFSGQADNAFVAARPPGHHAEKQTTMGFCFINSIAVAARHAQLKHGAERVAIVDWDVHHGNGTQDIFWDDKSVLFASTHQMPLYPGSGAKGEEGAGNVFNAPMSPGTDGEGFKEAFKTRVLPVVKNFKPDLILISAGFDAHTLDPLAQIDLVEDDFSWATGKLMDLAGELCGNRLVSLLEGGYDLQGLAESSAAHARRLMNG